MAIPPEVQAYLNGPACPAPEGETSNLDNPSNGNGAAFFVGILCIVLVTTATICRAYSRICIAKQLHVEDYLGISAIIPFAGLAWCYFDFGHKVGFFVQQWDLPGSIVVILGYHSILLSICYGLLMLLLKTAILLEWVRIFVPRRTRNVFYWSSVTLMLVNGGFYVAAIFVTFGACRPFEKLWHFWLPGQCIHQKARDFTSAVFNLVTDTSILLLPQRIIWTLQMSSRRRVGVSVVFSVGLLVVAMSAGRLHATVTMDYQDGAARPVNTTYKFSQTYLWVMCEVTCTFLVFCVPTLPILFSDKGIKSRITASWPSWIRLPQRSSSERPNKTSWPQNTGRTRDVPREIGRQNVADTPNHAATELKLVKQPSVEQIAYEDYNGSLSPFILKAAEFDSREEDTSKRSADRRHDA